MTTVGSQNGAIALLLYSTGRIVIRCRARPVSDS